MGTQKKEQIDVTVQGVGDTKEYAFASALGQIQNKINKNKHVLLRVEPLKDEVLSAKELCYKEKFLFFFFPRERRKYEIEIRVTVDVLSIEVDEIKFIKEHVKNEDGISLPFISKLERK